MTLRNQLYTITDRTASVYAVHLNGSHFIYQAHFPGEPITPGVCLLQMSKELLEDYLQRPLAVKAVKQMKFLAPLSPVADPDVTFVMEKIADAGDTVSAQVSVQAADKVFVTLSFTCHASK